MAEGYQTIAVERSEGITTVRFNRPEKRNAMSPQLHREMYDALRGLRDDAETQVLIITGTGDSFCAGQDLKEYFYELKDSEAERSEARRISHEWRHRILYHFPKPTICAINGWCFGGAFTVVASCDIAVAADEAVFGLSEINFGSFPGGLVARVVAGLMLPRQALYYMMTGQQFDGRRSAEIGFTTLSVPRARLVSTVHDLALNLKAKDPIGLRTTKEVFKQVDLAAMPFEDAYQWLAAKHDQMSAQQKGGWIERGIGGFIKKEYRPGLESMPRG
jgi:trans-feruloyl-CoA hydratase/vanillin synthase